MAVSEGRLAEQDIAPELARLAAFFADTKPGRAMGQEYVAMIQDQGWVLEGLRVAVTDCIRTLRFFPKPAELRMAYDLWASKAAFEARSGLGPQFAALAESERVALPAETRRTESERGDRLREVFRQARQEYLARLSRPEEHAKYCRERAAIRAQCQREGRPYFTEIEERLIEAGLYRSREELERRLEAKGLRRRV